jgi:E3 ubiquitin-protein ligase RNF14
VLLVDSTRYTKETRHGPIDTCPISLFENLAQEYLGAAEGSAEREKMELQFGRVMIRRLINQYEEEKANLQWLSKSAMQCPGCRCHVEKNMGCNHVRYIMICCWMLTVCR